MGKSCMNSTSYQEAQRYFMIHWELLLSFSFPNMLFLGIISSFLI
jgi:hypothetical protein